MRPATPVLRPVALAAALLSLVGCAALKPPAPSAAAPAAPPAAAPSRPAGGVATVAAVPGAAAASGPTAGGGAAPAAAARPDPTAPKPFAEVSRDFKSDDGYFAVWLKDEKVMLELPVERFGQPFLLTANVSESVGERGLYAGQMMGSWIVELRRIGNGVQLVAKNTDFLASGSDAALARTVRQGFSDSLLGAAPVASAEHPQRKSVLVDANLLLSDLLGYSTYLELAYRLPYGLDRANSYWTTASAEPQLTTLGARLHYATARIPAPPLVRPPIPVPTPPTVTPDPRSLFIGVVYSLRALPAQPMAPRAADPRLGHFTASFTDYANEMKPNLRVHHVTRWRLDKKDPQAALSPPVQPITFWLDRNIAQRYRASVEAGILEWNKAFERIGFQGAVVAKQQPDDATFDTLDAGHASIRWFVGADVGFARGPHVADPRTGEILDADIAMSDVFARGARRVVTEDLGPRAGALQAMSQAFGRRHDLFCDYAEAAGAEAAFALDLLEARAEMKPDSPEAEAVVQAYVKEVVMHEVGHTLGLRHNFKASTTITPAQLQDKAYTGTHGIASSVMDYVPFNIALAGERQADYVSPSLGAYDYWAIEYAYKPIAPADEAAELGRIAARSTEPELAYADDADADAGRGGTGIDPYTNRFDLGADPLTWYRKRFALSRELWDRVQARGPQPGDDPLRERRVLASGFRQLRDLPQLAAKFVGGMVVQRDLPGTTARPTYRPVPPARQREALHFVTDSVFSVDSFRFRPEFLAGLSPDFIEWERAQPVSIPTLVLGLQTQALDRLLAAGTAQRVLDLPSYLTPAERRGALTLNEVYATVQSAVWRELKQGGEIDPMRRNLQREHLKRLQALLIRPPGDLPADALSLARMQAAELQGQLRTAAGRSGLSPETRAHLQDSLGTLTEALRATMTRS